MLQGTDAKGNGTDCISELHVSSCNYFIFPQFFFPFETDISPISCTFKFLEKGNINWAGRECWDGV